MISVRHWSVFEYTSLHVAQIGRRVDGYFVLLISFLPPDVHVSPRRDSGVSSTLKYKILFFLITHSTTPLSDLTNTYLGSSASSSSLTVSRVLSTLYLLCVCVDSSSLTMLSLDDLEFSFGLSLHLLSDVLHVVDSALCSRSACRSGFLHLIVICTVIRLTAPTNQCH